MDEYQDGGNGAEERLKLGADYYALACAKNNAKQPPCKNCGQPCGNAYFGATHWCGLSKTGKTGYEPSSL